MIKTNHVYEVVKILKIHLVNEGLDQLEHFRCMIILKLMKSEIF